MSKPVIVGAVMYDPKVSVIWEIIQEFFESHGCPTDMLYYNNYTDQVDALLEGKIEIAWHSPLAWVDTVIRSNNRCRAIAMRDTDQDRSSHFVVHKDSPIKSLSDLKGKTIAFGAEDSPQARLIPMDHLIDNGIDLKDITEKRFDIGVGLHGDHIGGELDAFKCLAAGEADASVMLDLNWQTWGEDGTLSPSTWRVLSTTESFDHCVFAVNEDFDKEREAMWLDVLFKMSYDNPDHQRMMDLEGLKAWKVGRTSGFGPLTRAVKALDYFG